MLTVDEMTVRFFGETAHSACFWSLAGRRYRDGLARMAELTRDDPFWAGTNGEVTDGKLAAFCELLLERDPHDIGALWSLIGYDVRCCSNSISERCWKTLFELGEFEPRWLVEYSYWVQLVSGVDTAPLLAEVLLRHRLLDAVRPALVSLTWSDPPFSERWAARVAAAASSA